MNLLDLIVRARNVRILSRTTKFRIVDVDFCSRSVEHSEFSTGAATLFPRNSMNAATNIVNVARKLRVLLLPHGFSTVVV